MEVLEQPEYTKNQRGLGLQFLIAFLFGSFSLLTFSVCRRRLPQVYAARTLRKPGLPTLSKSYFGWIKDVIKVTDRDLLQLAGLDAYVYLMFFRAAITVLWRLSLVSLFFIAPLRWFYLGQFDDGDPDVEAGNYKEHNERPNLFGDYIWVYVASTYIFTIICLRTMRRYTEEIVSVRQAWLGHQNSITDRTLRISGIPMKLRSEQALKQYLTLLFGAEPESVVLCRKWERLDQMFSLRKKLIKKLEALWAVYLGPQNCVFTQVTPERFQIQVPESTQSPGGFDQVQRGGDDGIFERFDAGEEAEISDTFSINNNSRSNDGEERPRHNDVREDDYVDPARVWNSSEIGGIRAIAARLFPHRKRPVGRVQYGGLAGPKVDLLEHYERKLALLDDQIREERSLASEKPVTNMAFVTMKSLAQCQLAAQAIFSPKPHTMVNFLAPSPNDIVWQNVYLKSQRRSVSNYIISLVVLTTNLFLIIPLKYISRFLDISIIRQHFPTFGNWLADRKWMAAFVTDVLPTYVFSSFNLVVPYFFAWLSKRQGFISKSDVELSTIGKCFFYFFVNLFLIFTIESTFLSFSVDKMAKDFAYWLIRLSSFYTNLIILQGIGITPFKLLQPGSIFQFPFLASRCRTARDYHELYKPQKINYGLVLPVPMFIFIVTLTYSILRRRILLFGLIYFATSYFVFKYELLYCVTHPQHSNAQLWTIILRRVYLGIGVFHLAMIGVLVLQSEYQFALLILPLLLLLLGSCYDFEMFTKPLLEFVAVEALRQREVDQYDLGTYRTGSSEIPNDSGTGSPAGVGPSDADASPGSDRRSQLRHRASTHSIIDRAEAFASFNLSHDANELPNRLWERHSVHDRTLDEERESGLQYINKSLVAPLDGPWIATSAFECIVANPTGFETRPISYAEWL